MAQVDEQEEQNVQEGIAELRDSHVDGRGAIFRRGQEHPTGAPPGIG